MNIAINIIDGTNFCPLSFKRQLVKLCITFENNMFPLTFMATMRKKWLKCGTKFNAILFRHKMNNRYETNILLANNNNRLYLQRVKTHLANTNLPCGPLLNAVTGWKKKKIMQHIIYSLSRILTHPSLLLNLTKKKNKKKFLVSGQNYQCKYCRPRSDRLKKSGTIKVSTACHPVYSYTCIMIFLPIKKQGLHKNSKIAPL